MDFMQSPLTPFSGASNCLKFNMEHVKDKEAKKRRPFTAPVDVSRQRTPNALPLQYNQKNMHDIRMERTAVRMNQKRIVDQKKNTSTYCCKEAKDLLDFCVKKGFDNSTSDIGSETHSRQKSRHTSSTLITKSYYGTSVPTFFDGTPKGQKMLYRYPKNTGPTYQGSPMHNKRAKEMSELKNLPKENLQDIHDRAQSCPPQIKQRLKEYDKTYRVQPSLYSPDGDTSIMSGISSCQFLPQSGADYILIPLDPSRRTSRQSFDTRSMYARSRMASQHESELPIIEDNKAEKMSGELPIKEATTAEVIQPEKLTKVSEITPTNTTSVQQVTAMQSKMEMDLENEVPMTEEGEEIVEKPLVYPDTFRCWVDDATVSSIPKSQPDLPEPEPEPEEPKSGKKVKIDDKKNKGKDKKKGGKKGKEPEPEPEPEPAPPPKPDPPPPVVEEPIIIIEEPPNYICPRSESKSREAETRKWLENNSFPYALHSMPLF